MRLTQKDVTAAIPLSSDAFAAFHFLALPAGAKHASEPGALGWSELSVTEVVQLTAVQLVYSCHCKAWDDQKGGSQRPVVWNPGNLLSIPAEATWVTKTNNNRLYLQHNNYGMKGRGKLWQAKILSTVDCDHIPKSSLTGDFVWAHQVPDVSCAQLTSGVFAALWKRRCGAQELHNRRSRELLVVLLASGAKPSAVILSFIIPCTIERTSKWSEKKKQANENLL